MSAKLRIPQVGVAMLAALLLSACATPSLRQTVLPSNPDEFLIVDCLLPGQVRRLGTRIVYLAPRRGIRTPARQCEIRGGEYAAYDRANASTSLKVWLPQAQEGDAQAQTYVGEIFEKGLGVEPDYDAAALWYGKAAAQSYARAQINLGYLHEAGLGVQQDLPEAMNLYRRASGIDDGTLEYVSTVEFAQRERAQQETTQLRSQVAEMAQQLADADERYRSLQQQSRVDEQALMALHQLIRVKRQAVKEQYQHATEPRPASVQALMEIDSLRQALNDERAERQRLEEALSISRESVQRVKDEQDQDNAQTLAMQRELKEQLARQAAKETQLNRQLQEAESRYQHSISALQSDLDLSVSKQTRVAEQLAYASQSLQNTSTENVQLRQQLAEQNAAVAAGEQEHQWLSAELSAMTVSTQITLAERRASEATLREVKAELALARFEQSRLVTQLIEAELTAQQASLSAAEQLALLEKQLATQSGIVETQQEQMNTLEQQLGEARAREQFRPADTVSQVVAAGPAIEIIDPPVLITRGPAQIPAGADGTVSVVGRVSPVDNLLAFSINGKRQITNASGLFDFQSSTTINKLELVAINDAGQRTHVQVSVADAVEEVLNSPVQPIATPQSSIANTIDFGRYYAIVIGNNQYANMSDLRTAETDAQVINDTLRQRYGFTTELLVNATQLEILSALNTAQETLTDKDNLIIYYAGHGQLDPNGGSGYWLPSDAEAGDTGKWISNAIITNYLDSIEAKQIMVIADSCFSGTLTQASIPRTQEAMPDALRARWLNLMAKRKVRTVLSSGGVKPVFDGVSKHSLFADAFISELSGNAGVLEGYRLFSSVRERVQQSALSLGVDQAPQYAAVKHAGHEVGEFLLVAR